MKNTNVFIYTATYFYLGRVVKITRSWVVLDNSSIVAHIGRPHLAFSTGELRAVEVLPADLLQYVARAPIISVTPWRFPLPTITK